MSRVIEVAPERLERWLTGFAERHGPYDATRESTAGGVLVRAEAADGAVAVADPFDHDPLGIVLVRRGGYAVAIAVAGRLVDAKVGARHVQSRTAAGGWSQQRFARRRGKQADELVGAVAVHARRILLRDDESPRRGAPGQQPPGLPYGLPYGLPHGLPCGLVVGGDRTLVREVLESPALRALRGLPVRELFDLPDPRRDVLEAAVRRGRSYRITLTEPTPSSP
ncbi:Vms1/Ankzf1 family peptidyl-tRNA hydrolase [Intrasporangium sp. DVR]|uniref:Vms1/Ankzf1 family peptidyl-tRNA hydrolase n=1 Tax=Intrasporangium sp. DVR TaxID=3127867 RepID=UPI00313A6B73